MLDPVHKMLVTPGRFIRFFWNQGRSAAEFYDQYCAQDPVGWEFVGAGDIDGDLFDDMMWYHTETGEFAYWLMSGIRVKETRRGIFFTAGYTPRKVSDFNGDTLADVLLSDGVGLKMLMSSQNGGFTEGAVHPGYPEGWTLLGR